MRIDSRRRLAIAYRGFLASLVRYLGPLNCALIGQYTRDELFAIGRGMRRATVDLQRSRKQRHCYYFSFNRADIQAPDGQTVGEWRDTQSFHMFFRDEWEDTIASAVSLGWKLDLLVVGRQVSAERIVEFFQAALPLLQGSMQILLLEPEVGGAENVCGTLRTQGWQGASIGGVLLFRREGN